MKISIKLAPTHEHWSCSADEISNYNKCSPKDVCTCSNMNQSSGMLSSFEQLCGIPCGTVGAFATGQITKIFDTDKKMTAILSCSTGENFVVTAFKKTDGWGVFRTSCHLGNIVKLEFVKAQRFDLSRFDGKAFFQTPFDFELVVLKSSKVNVVASEIKQVTKLVDLQSGGN